MYMLGFAAEGISRYGTLAAMRKGRWRPKPIYRLLCVCFAHATHTMAISWGSSTPTTDVTYLHWHMHFLFRERPVLHTSTHMPTVRACTTHNRSICMGEFFYTVFCKLLIHSVITTVYNIEDREKRENTHVHTCTQWIRHTNTIL